MAAANTHESVTQAEFELFYIRTAAKLRGYLGRLCRDPFAADEVLQEAYIRVVGAPAMDELQRKSYLYTTATNVLRDRWRRQKRRDHEFNLPCDMAAIFDQRHRNAPCSGWRMWRR